MKTQRLQLRPLVPDHAAELYAIYSDPRAMRYMPTPPHRTVDETERYLAREQSLPGAHHWVMSERGRDRPIGLINFLGGTRVPGMGYILHPQYWGQGLTAEAGVAVLGYGFGQLGYDRVELWINEENRASIRVAEKLGFAVRGRLAQKYAHEASHHFMLVFGLRARECTRSRSGQEVESTRFFGIEPVLPVHDVIESAHYYRDKLGFQVDFVYGDPAEHAAVSRGEWSGSMVTIQLTRVPDDRSLGAPGYLYLLVDSSIDELAAQFRSQGVRLMADPEDKPWGMREFQITDLNGHRLLFGTHR